MKVVKKIFLTLVNVLSIAIIVLAILMLLTVLMTRSGSTPNFMGYSVFRVMSPSMEPALMTDSLIVVKNTDPQEVKPHDIITFYSSDPELMGELNTHRVVGISEENGEIAFVTKGDANVIEDKYLARGSKLVGVVIFSSYVLGVVVKLASNPVVFVPLILLPLVLMLAGSLFRTVRLSKQMIREEEEAALNAAREALRKKQEETETAAKASDEPPSGEQSGN